MTPPRVAELLCSKHCGTDARRGADIARRAALDTRLPNLLEPEVISRTFESDLTWPEGPLFHAGNLYFTDTVDRLL